MLCLLKIFLKRIIVDALFNFSHSSQSKIATVELYG